MAIASAWGRVRGGPGGSGSETGACGLVVVCAGGAGGTAWPMSNDAAAAAMTILRMLRSAILPAVDQQISRGNDEDGQDHRRGQAADDGPRHGSVLFGAGPHFQGHGNHADDGGQ